MRGEGSWNIIFSAAELWYCSDLTWQEVLWQGGRRKGREPKKKPKPFCCWSCLVDHFTHSSVTTTMDGFWAQWNGQFTHSFVTINFSLCILNLLAWFPLFARYLDLDMLDEPQPDSMCPVEDSHYKYCFLQNKLSLEDLKSLWISL